MPFKLSIFTNTYFENRIDGKIWCSLFLLFQFISCTAPKFTFEHEGISQLDFKNGKWILNNLTSNGFTNDLDRHSFKKWGEIIKDSLYSLNNIRVNNLIPEKIDFEIPSDILKNLGRDSKCDFIINTKVEIINSELSALSRPRQPAWGTTFRSNEASTLR